MPSAALVRGVSAYIIASIVVLAVLFIGLPAIPRLLAELNFYRECEWDLSKESGIQIYRQQEIAHRFSFLPIGWVKLLYYANRVFLMLIIAIPLAIGVWREI